MSRVAEWLKSAGLGQFCANFNGIDEEQFLSLQVCSPSPHVRLPFSSCHIWAPRPVGGGCRSLKLRFLDNAAIAYWGLSRRNAFRFVLFHPA